MLGLVVGGEDLGSVGVRQHGPVHVGWWSRSLWLGSPLQRWCKHSLLVEHCIELFLS